MALRARRFGKVVPALAAAGWLLVASASCSPQTPLTLHEAVREGLARSAEAKASTEMVEVKRAAVRQAGLRPNPRLFLQSEDLRPWASNFSFADSTEDYGYLSQTFELDGKRGKRIASSRVSLKHAEAEHRLLLLQVAGRIAEAYWYAVEAGAARQLWQQQLSGFDQTVDYQSKRVNDGAAAGVDLLRMQIERDRVALEYGRAQLDADAAMIQLEKEMGVPVGKVNLADTLESTPAVEVRVAEAALEDRPDVAIARDEVEQAATDIRLQHAAAVPDLDLLGGYKRNVGVDTLYGALQIPLPIFNRNQGNISAAEAQKRVSEDQLAQVRWMALAEIRSAQERYVREAAAVGSLLPKVKDEAGRNEAIVREAYAAGGMDLLRYLDAKRTLIDTQLLSLQTMGNFQRAAVQLMTAYGEQP